MNDMKADRDSFRKLGLTFEEKAFYDILISLRDAYNFEYGTDRDVNGIIVNDKCKTLAKRIKEIIDTKSSFADWLNNQIVRDQLKAAALCHNPILFSVPAGNSSDRNLSLYYNTISPQSNVTGRKF